MSLLPTAACVVQGSNPHRTIIESVVQMQSSLRLIASEWGIKSTKCAQLEANILKGWTLDGHRQAKIIAEASTYRNQRRGRLAIVRNGGELPRMPF